MPGISTYDGIVARVRKKKEDYRRYNFERLQEEAFATFFDLAQEYTALETLYQICVAVPKEFLRLNTRLYVLNPKRSKLELVSSSDAGLVEEGGERLGAGIRLGDDIYERDGSVFFPIRGNVALAQWMPSYLQGGVLGVFEVFPADELDPQNRFFLEKLVNRIGYNLHQKMLIKQNIEHIKFINHLVADIEHNVITPNMYYKLFIRRLQKALKVYGELEEKLRDQVLFMTDSNPAMAEQFKGLLRGVSSNNEKVTEELQTLTQHYQHTSLFLETLFRREHFVKGTYVLRKQACNFRTEIVEPLMERYHPKFKRKGIVVDNMLEGMPDEQMTLFVDKGLISQVFDNLFSNAVKYTREVEDQLGHRIKLVSCNRRMLKNHFGEGTHGVRFNIFSTGVPLPEEEVAKLFQEGYRASNVEEESGTGHGLHFVRNVVMIHGGEAGCEPQRYGNTFYFVLPVKEQTLPVE